MDLGHSQMIKRTDIVTRYYDDVDIFTLFFARASPGFVEYSDEASPTIMIDYTETDTIVAVSVENASSTLGFPPRHPIGSAMYERTKDIVTVLFVDVVESKVQWESTDIEQIVLGYDEAKKIVGLRILKAADSIARSLSPEEAKQCELKVKREIQARRGLWGVNKV